MQLTSNSFLSLPVLGDTRGKDVYWPLTVSVLVCYETVCGKVNLEEKSSMRLFCIILLSTGTLRGKTEGGKSLRAANSLNQYLYPKPKSCLCDGQHVSYSLCFICRWYTCREEDRRIIRAN